MSSNLPPGVRQSDIPGSRPIDEYWEKIARRLPDWMWEQIQDGTELGEVIGDRISEQWYARNNTIQEDIQEIVSDMSKYKDEIDANNRP